VSWDRTGVGARTGEAINDLKRVIEEAISAKGGEILETANAGWTDLTGPGKNPGLGSVHLVTKAIDEITRIFEKIGFIGRDHADHEDVRSCLGEVWALAFINP